jgi:hypothetical protein
MSANGARISGLTRDLIQKWQDTRQSWRDSKSLEFERQYIADLLGAADKTAATIEQVEKLMQKIRKDCE